MTIDCEKQESLQKRSYLPLSPTCFACGKDNHAGLQGLFYVENDKVYMPLCVKHHHCGYPEVVHGGIVATALDETMAWAATRALGRMCVTGKLTVRYLERTPATEDLLVCAEVVKAHRRIVYTTAELADGSGRVYARAEGSFLPLSAEETLRIDDGLLYEAHTERIFDALRAEQHSFCSGA